MHQLTIYQPKEPWNKNKLVGQKLPLKLQQIWAIRIRLELFHKIRDLALFNLAIDSKLRGCDLVFNAQPIDTPPFLSILDCLKNRHP